MNTHQESIEPFECLELRTDMVVAPAQAAVVVVPPAQVVVVVVVPPARAAAEAAHTRAVVVHTQAVVQVAAPRRNCRQAGSREILR